MIATHGANMVEEKTNLDHTGESRAQTRGSVRTEKQWLEPAAAIVATGFIATVLVLITFNAGPLWRDEVNSINVAEMPSLKQLWSNLRFESFPALWLMLLRGWSFLGLAENDLSIRFLGLLM